MLIVFLGSHVQLTSKTQNAYWFLGGSCNIDTWAQNMHPK
jgi:hypothetical protein